MRREGTLKVGPIYIRLPLAMGFPSPWASPRHGLPLAMGFPSPIHFYFTIKFYAYAYAYAYAFKLSFK